MKIRRIIIYDKKKVTYAMVLKEVQLYFKKYPIFIGTAKQWNYFLKDVRMNQNKKSKGEK